MNILFACGGTAGHINPALSLARLFRQRDPEGSILFVGAEGGMETRLVPREGFELRTVTISSFYRSLSPAALRHNLRTVGNLRRSKRQMADILDHFPADLAVGTGGYASYPAVREAARRGIPTAVHESNALPGLTTKALSKVTDRVLVSFESSRAYYKNPEKVVVTGTPVRGDFFRYTRQQARQELGLEDGRPLLASFFGSLGAERMNGYMAEFFRLEERAGFPFHHIHGAGRDYEAMAAECPKNPSLDLRAYIYDMPLVCAAADLVICRAGASTVAEMAAIAKPAIFIPSPNVTADHQTKNAQALASRGGAVLLAEGDCSGQRLYDEAAALLSSHPPRPARREARAAHATTHPAEA
ncbi:MAG: UDP-N-acetylglucosamine--N-acetylmuramyl-(pentapeptide) pyrophosphoryl-undecaprenol N-acetylglucosamine transferase, partial [Oscillospiraceae bacterium]|nr:UDP-N-acetylglucosamine--N-acetylmuramyl-(pentapeptide) pyrophosphoryl-undecaprenol N-acetylglucosamine transferase [Oscillospiraceae bacterium]